MTRAAQQTGLPPVQLSLLDDDYIRQVWRVHKKSLPGYTLQQALEHEWYGRLLRCHAACLERQNARGRKR